MNAYAQTKVIIRVDLRIQHLHEGRRHSVTCCPLSLALKELMGASDAIVSNQCVGVLRDRNDWLIYLAEPPDKVKTFIEAFDRGEPVEPESFFLHFRPFPRAAIPPNKGPWSDTR